MSGPLVLPKDIDPSLIEEFTKMLDMAQARAKLLTHNLRLPPNASPELTTLIVLGRCINVLKVERRWEGRNVVEADSIADHTGSLMIRAAFVAGLRKYDVLRTIMIAGAHDMPELLTTDIIIYLHPAEKRPQIKKMKHEIEYIAMDLVAQAIGGEFGKFLFDLWLEYENGSSPEARLVKQLDKAEAAEQAMHFAKKKPEHNGLFKGVIENLNHQIFDDPLLHELFSYMQMLSVAEETGAP